MPESNSPVLRFNTQAAWDAWLLENHLASAGVWLQFAKKDSGLPSITYADALETALCYGWIDGQKKSLDESFWLQKFTPRGKRSIWSKVNREKAEALIRSGQMKPAGLQQVDLAKQDGRWQAAYDSQSSAIVPDDLQAELDRNPQAKDFFLTLDSRNRYAILFRIQTAKKPETRRQRIEKFVKMLENHETLY